MKTSKQQFKDLSIMDKLFVIGMTLLVGTMILVFITLAFNL